MRTRAGANYRVFSHAAGVVPKIPRNISTNAVACRYPSPSATSLTDCPETSSSIAFISRTCRRQNSKSVPVWRRKTLCIVRTLAPDISHSVTNVWRSPGWLITRSAIARARPSCGSVRDIGIGEAVSSCETSRSRSAQ